MPSINGIAILGAGIFAKEAHLPALATLGANAPALKAVYSRSEKSAQDLSNLAKASLHLDQAPSVYHDASESSNLEVLLGRNDIDAVILVLPITQQPAIILKALHAGKHVLSEKPVAPDVAGGLELIRKYNEQYKPRGLIWRVAENFEAEPGVRVAADAISSGQIGDVVAFKALTVNYVNEDSKWYKTPWRTVPDYQGGFVLDGGVHTIAVLRAILPKPITHLSGFASLTKEILKPHDTVHAIVKSDGAQGTLELTWGFPVDKKPQADQFVITGTKGWLSINIAWGSSGGKFIVNITKKPEDSKGQVDEQVIKRPSEGVKAELEDFFKALIGEKTVTPVLGDPAGALFDVAVIQAALTSNGRLVDLVELQATG
ncbi:oxidoreductase family protein [Coprinopsis sp. MPI-PUGE-AT-0042]|nr:oxidoreductase family protein [Coprinopsis sp. MPI-PUGE-AT-0042]